MKIENLSINNNYIDEVVSLWNSSVSEEFVYKSLGREEFIKIFTCNFENNFIMLLDGELIGFLSLAFIDKEAYITMLIIKDSMRKKGYGAKFLEFSEEFIRNHGFRKIKMDFFNPVNLSWFIPNTNKHDHPNAPGVDISSEAYSFFKSHGYLERTREISMHMNLDKFNLPISIDEKIEALKKEHIEISFYNKERHYGFDYLFRGLKNHIWENDIEKNLSLEHPYPIIIAAKDGKICGFAGPLRVEKSGRGLFAGIGVHPIFQGMGIGKVLFFVLCNNFKGIGADFMSLFTGENNNARKIYEECGFEIKKTFALLIKEI